MNDALFARDRVLSSSSSTRAVLLSYAGGLISLGAATLASLFGAVALAADWERTGFGHAPRGTESGLVLPLVLQYLTPNVSDFTSSWDFGDIIHYHRTST